MSDGLNDKDRGSRGKVRCQEREREWFKVRCG